MLVPPLRGQTAGPAPLAVAGGYWGLAAVLLRNRKRERTEYAGDALQ